MNFSQDEGSVCQTCFRGTLSLTYGFLVCDTCGQTQQSFLEETQEHQALTRRIITHTTRRQPPSSTFKQVKEKKKTVTAQEVEECLRSYVQMLQDLLREGMERVLIHLIKPVSQNHRANYEHVVRDLWFQHVATTEVLEESKHGRLADEISGSTTERDETHAIFERFLNDCLPMTTMYAILFLGCWLTREAIDPYDITSVFAFTGTLRAKSESIVEISLASQSYLCPGGLPNPLKVYLDARSLAEYLGVVLPPLCAATWLGRFNTDGSAHISMFLYADSWHYMTKELPWSSIAYFIDKRTGKPKDSLMLPYDTSYVVQLGGLRELQNYVRWFLLSTVEDKNESEEFDFFLEKIESRIMLETEQGGRPYRQTVLPWCQVEEANSEIERLMSRNEVNLIYHTMNKEEHENIGMWRTWIREYQTRLARTRTRTSDLL
jgi:hypothetical protein